MIRTFFYLSSCVLLFGISRSSFSQHQAGIQYSNYADVVSAVSNPALIASSKVSIGVNIINAEATVFNNYTKWNAPFSFLSFFTGRVPNEYLSPGGLVVWQNGYAKTKQNKNLINGNASVRALGPSFLMNSKKYGFGFQVGVNLVGFGSFAGTSEEIGRHIVEIRPPSLYNTPITDNQSAISIGFYKEFYVSLSKNVIKRKDQSFNVGVSFKYLTSNNFLGLNASSLDYRVSPSTSLPNKSRTVFEKTQGTFFFAQGNTGINGTSILQELASIKSLGTGFGGTLGVSYEYRPNQLRYAEKKDGIWTEKTNEVGYALKIGVSLEDIGYLKYTNVQVGEVNDNSTVVFDNDDFRDNTRPTLFINLIEQKYNLNPADYGNTFEFILPARLHAFIDYKCKENKFVTLFLNQSVLSNKRIAPFGVSTFGVVPRFENRNVMLSVPVVVSNNFQHLTLGLTGRFRAFYLGTNHLPGFFNFSKTAGLSLYGGIFLPLYGKKQQLENDCYYPGDKKRKKIAPFQRKRSY